MAASDKKVRKDQKRRERAKRDVARQERRRFRAAAKEQNEEVHFVDPAHAGLFTSKTDAALMNTSAPASKPSTPEASNSPIEKWWDYYLEVDGPQRLSMVREKLGEDLNAEWRESIFPPRQKNLWVNWGSGSAPML